MEDQNLVDSSLASLDEQLKQIGGTSRAAFDRATELYPEYIENKEFRLMFLRAERFVVEKAARRIVQHFKDKLELFGETKLGKKIAFEDLSKDDQAAVICGAAQCLGSKDTKGRMVLYAFPKLLEYVTWENHVSYLKCSSNVMPNSSNSLVVLCSCEPAFTNACQF